MGNARIITDHRAAICGMIWFVLIIDACFTWFVPDIARSIVGSFFIIYASFILYQNQGIIFSKQRETVAIFLLLLMFYLILTRFSAARIISVLFTYGPFVLVIFWRDSVLLKFYDLFRKFIVFYAILSIFVEVLVLTHLWTRLPCMIFPPQDFVQEELGYVNYFYGFFCIPAEDTSLSFYRACGPLREGGHFVFFIGFVYFVEKALYNKRNIWLILCGVLTLSPNIVVILLITEFYCAIKRKSIIKPIIGIMGVAAGAFLLYFFSPQVIKDEINRIIFERMLEKSIENATDGGGFMAILDARGMEGKMSYDSFIHAGFLDKMIGARHFDGEDLMSDFRWMIMYCGFVGTFLYICFTVVLAFQKNQNLFGLCILIFALLIFLQRAWMFNQPYVWTMMLLTATMNSNLSKKRHHARIVKK